MSESVPIGRPARLSREGVLRAAIGLADSGGLGSLTIRSLAEELGAKPMSVYHHVANKEEILDGIIDLVFAEIELPAEGHWRARITARSHSAREVLRRHRWAIGLMESRSSPGPASLRHHDAVIGTFRAAGFTVEQTAHAYALLDSYIYGFALQEASLPFEGPDPSEVTGEILQTFAGAALPHLTELATEYVMRPGYDFGDEFGFGLELILGALAASLDDREASQATPGK